MYFNLLLLYLSNRRWKNTKYLKIYETNQQLKLFVRVLIAVSSCPAAANLYMCTPRSNHPSSVSSSRKNTRLKTKKIRDIQQSLFFTVCFNVTFMITGKT